MYYNTDLTDSDFPIVIDTSCDSDVVTRGFGKRVDLPPSVMLESRRANHQHPFESSSSHQPSQRRGGRISALAQSQAEIRTSVSQMLVDEFQKASIKISTKGKRRYRQRDPVEMVIWYLGYRDRAIPTTTSFLYEGCQLTPPSDVERIPSDQYSNRRQAARNVLLRAMAPELRTHYHDASGKATVLDVANYKAHHEKFGPWSPFAHYVLLYEPSAKLVKLFCAQIHDREAGDFYKFRHWQLELPAEVMTLTKMNEEEDVHLWMKTNISYIVPNTATEEDLYKNHNFEE